MESKLEQQYQQIAEAIETDGLGYAILHGYIRPDMTDDQELKEAIEKASGGLRSIDKIMEPYKI